MYFVANEFSRWTIFHLATTNERKVFRLLEVSFDNAISTDEGLARVRIDDYECIISDMKRKEGTEQYKKAGIEFIKRLRDEVARSDTGSLLY